MRESLIILASFILGVLLALVFHVDAIYSIDLEQFSSYALYFLLFIVGVNIGTDSSIAATIRKIERKSLLLPLFSFGGTILGAVVAFLLLSATSLLLPAFSLHKLITIASGMGYYSITAILTGEVWGAQVASVALLVNLMRELFTILLAPIVSKIFGRYAATALGGATAIDTTLPIIMKTDGNSMIPIAIYCGMFFTIAVPVILSVLLSL